MPIWVIAAMTHRCLRVSPGVKILASLQILSGEHLPRRSGDSIATGARKNVVRSCVRVCGTRQFMHLLPSSQGDTERTSASRPPQLHLSVRCAWAQCTSQGGSSAPSRCIDHKNCTYHPCFERFRQKGGAALAHLGCCQTPRRLTHCKGARLYAGCGIMGWVGNESKISAERALQASVQVISRQLTLRKEESNLKLQCSLDSKFHPFAPNLWSSTPPTGNPPQEEVTHRYKTLHKLRYDLEHKTHRSRVESGKLYSFVVSVWRSYFK